jgi:hypothetical protein
VCIQSYIYETRSDLPALVFGFLVFLTSYLFLLNIFLRRAVPRAACTRLEGSPGGSLRFFKLPGGRFANTR